MNTQDAEKIIRNLEAKHRLFKHLSFKCHDKGVFIVFEQIDIDPRTISRWFDAAGCYALYVGSEGTKDNRVMVAELRI